jgi:hypothetical protein
MQTAWFASNVLHSFNCCNARRRYSPNGRSPVFLLVVTFVALCVPCVPWCKSEPLPPPSRSEPASSFTSLPGLSPEPSTIPSPELSLIVTASSTSPSLFTTPEYEDGIQGMLHTGNFVYMIDGRGKMRRCGPTPSSGDCTLFNKLSDSGVGGGGPMAVLNSSHIIVTSSNHMV